MLTDTQTQPTTEQPKEDPRDYWRNFPEAPYSASIKYIDDKGFEVLATARGWTWNSMLTSLGKTEQAILDAGGKPIISKDNRPAEPLPAAPKAPAMQVPAMEEGMPVVDGDHNPVMVDLPSNQHVFHIKELFRDKRAGDNGKYVLKVVVEEDYAYGNGKWGIGFFRQEGVYADWATWELGKRFSPRLECTRVIVEDPKPGKKFANIVRFIP